MTSALTWGPIQKLYDPDPVRHHAHAHEAGLDCPADVFEQLFHEPHADEAFASLLRFIDWREVRWHEHALSGIALRQVAVPRDYQHALDEAHAFTLAHGLQDERPAVMQHWTEEGTWLRAPVLVAGALFDTHVAHVCLVGITRLGDLLGLLDRGEVPEAATHHVWLGERARR